MKTNSLVLCLALSCSVFILGLSQLPWWLIALPAGIVGFFYSSSKRAFIHVFLVGFVVWAGVAVAQDGFAGFRTSPRIAGVFSLPAGFLAYVVTGLVAGLITGTAAWIGQSLTYLVASKPAG